MPLVTGPCKTAIFAGENFGNALKCRCRVNLKPRTYDCRGLMLSTVIRIPCAVTPQPPHQAACRSSTLRRRASVCLAGMGGHLSLITPFPWHVYGGEGGQRAVTVQMQCKSVVTELYQDAFVGSSIENGTTISQFDLRKLDFQCVVGTTATICWRPEPYPVDMHELSTFHNPIKYRLSVAQGYSRNDQNQRVYFTLD